MDIVSTLWAYTINVLIIIKHALKIYSDFYGFIWNRFSDQIVCQLFRATQQLLYIMTRKRMRIQVFGLTDTHTSSLDYMNLVMWRWYLCMIDMSSKVNMHWASSMLNVTIIFEGQSLQILFIHFFNFNYRLFYYWVKACALASILDKSLLYKISFFPFQLFIFSHYMGL